MADGNANATNRERLPIKLIMPEQGTERRVTGGGGPPRRFRTVDLEYRQSLLRQVVATRDALFPPSARLSAAPIRVQLITRAVAKSHRPEQLFSTQTCPIVGAGRLGELFVKATPGGLAKLESIIETGGSNQTIKELSSVEAIEPITAAFRCKGLSPSDLLRKSPRIEKAFVTRVRLFSFGGDEDQSILVADFEETCRNAGIHLTQDGYAVSSLIYAAECSTTAQVELLSNVVGVRSINSMPVIRPVRRPILNALPFEGLVTRDQVAGEIPVVVVVDSGISDSVPGLKTWVVGQESSVAPQYRNEDHGTFVAGLICWGSELNPSIRNIDGNACGIYDLQVIPNGDPAKGDVDSLREQEFLVTLEDALRRHANDYKVWNLSLSSDAICSLDEFSAFAEELDNLQEKYGISFVISAGNYTVPPLLDFPRHAGQIAAGRITAPADSVLGITVGSISQIDYKQNGPREHEPTPYSRHGAGPNYIIKPDLVHYGGTCSLDGIHSVGIRSVCDAGLVENLGTSFATPLVSRTLAQIYHQVTPTPSPVLARALLTHHARDPRTAGRVPDGEENYFGFGLPAPVPYCLECTPHTSTLIFDDALRPGYYLEWDDFPYPSSLTRDGRFFGEIWMTVAFAPARGSRWGSEYCETHIDAHFGVHYDQVSRATGKITPIFRGLVPPEHKNPGLLYESYQIERLRKWAPVRTYHGDLGPNGQRGNRWRLKVQLLTRHRTEAKDETSRPQPFSLIVTISDPLEQAPVYDEMARIVLNRFQAQNLSLRSVARIRGSVQE